jgi:DICT domain-containing protein
VRSFEEGPGVEVDGRWSLSVGEIARRTGVSVRDLRNWEARHGFPTPVRTVGGQRRYREEDCALVEEVARHRRGGLSVGAAIAAVLARRDQARDGSLFAATCRRHAELQPQTLTKRVLLALTWAIEDHVSATAAPVLLIGAFQEPGFYHQSASRWQDLAGTAELTIVFGAATSRPRRNGTFFEMQVPDRSPLRREWVLVCDGPEAACVLARERPGQSRQRDPDRLFETVWSIDPVVVRSASHLALSLADEQVPGLASTRLSVPPPAAQPEIRALNALVHRTLGYLIDSPSAKA